MLEKLIVFVEEYSMEIALENILPLLLADTDFEIHRFQCKDDLIKNLPARLKGYSSWLPQEWRILVLLDRDDDDCVMLKQRLENMTAEAGLISKTTAGQAGNFQVANRIAVEELESWFFGDWQAVTKAYLRVAANIPQKQQYRHPDSIRGGTWEALERVLKAGGYFKTGLRKAELAREVTPCMEPKRNTSTSFQAFRQAVEAALQ